MMTYNVFMRKALKPLLFIVTILNSSCDLPQKLKMMYNLSRISVKMQHHLLPRLDFVAIHTNQHFYNLQSLSNSSLNVQFRLKRDLFDETTTKATQR